MNPDVLHSTFDIILEREPAMTARFYDILFTRYPQARPLFGANSSRAQQEMLQKALTAVIDNLDNASWLASTLGGLGAKHVEYGVTQEMYAWVGDALLATLAEILKEEWTSEVAASWQDAYGMIRDLMLAGTPGEDQRAIVTPVAQPTL